MNEILLKRIEEAAKEEREQCREDNNEIWIDGPTYNDVEASFIKGANFAFAYLSKLLENTETDRNSRLYNIWHCMKQRCYNPKSAGYKIYGKKGIKVCDSWKNNFFCFAIWAVLNGYKEDLSIDRINTLGNYEPSNCRWADVFTQANNRTTNKDIGISMTMAELARKNGIKYSTLKHRIERCGMTAEEAITCTMHNPRKVLQFDMDGNFIREFPSARAAAIFLGGSSSTSTHIRNVCTGRRKSALGYIFKYEEKSIQRRKYTKNE